MARLRYRVDEAGRLVEMPTDVLGSGHRYGPLLVTGGAFVYAVLARRAVAGIVDARPLAVVERRDLARGGLVRGKAVGCAPDCEPIAERAAAADD